MAYSYVWDETSPAGSSNISLGDDRIREMKVTLREALDDEHTSLTSAPTGPLMHSWATASKSTGSPYTALSSDHVLLITTGASSYTINLPTAVGITGKPYKVKKADSGVGTVIIDANGTETIDGALTFVLSHQNDFVDLVSDGANWKIVSTNTNLDWDNVWTDAVHSHASDAEGGVLTYSQMKFLATPVNKVNWSAATGWTDVDISANTGADTAKAALLAVEATLERSHVGAGGLYSAVLGLFRKNGSTEASILSRIRCSTDRVAATVNVHGEAGCNIVVECDSSEIFEVKLQEVGDVAASTITFKVDLIGYWI
jgi:hypothetical protein